jgi:hypothetical protein
MNDAEEVPSSQPDVDRQMENDLRYNMLLKQAQANASMESVGKEVSDANMVDAAVTLESENNGMCERSSVHSNTFADELDENMDPNEVVENYARRIGLSA